MPDTVRMRLDSISRHLIKGLRPEALLEGRLIPSRGLEGDRAFAFQFMDESVPEELRKASAEVAPWMSKFFLAEQHDWPALARVVPKLDGDILTLVADMQEVRGLISDAGDRARLAAWLEAFLATTKPFEGARHSSLAPLRLIGSLDLAQRYTDGTTGPLSLMTIETLQDLEIRLGVALDWRVFRLNLLISGSGKPWAEQDWKGRVLRVGECELQILKPIARCPNIDVHPETGERGPEIFPRLRQVLGHNQVGMRVEVLRGGLVRAGDQVELVP